MTITFFGHRNSPSNIRDTLKSVLIDLIEHRQADQFYVGNQGSFDLMVYDLLKELKIQYPRINYNVVLAYFPEETEQIVLNNTIYPDGLEMVPRKFAIDRRNYWMVE